MGSVEHGFISGNTECERSVGQRISTDRNSVELKLSSTFRFLIDECNKFIMSNRQSINSHITLMHSVQCNSSLNYNSASVTHGLIPIVGVLQLLVHKQHRRTHS
jgi:hypothetical protein